jgi:predicted porin
MNIKFTLVAAATLVATTLPAQIAPIPVTANTNISISGLLAIGEKSSTITHSNRAGLTTETYLADNTSRLYINSNSKIADGWAAIAQIGSRFEPNDGPGTNLLPNNSTLGLSTGANYGGWAEDDTWGGLSSPYGSITFGKNTVYYTDTIATDALGLAAPGESYRIWDANGLGTFNILDSVMLIGAPASGTTAAVPGVTLGQKYTLGNTRSQNVIKYTSPRIGDFAFTLNYSKNPYNSELQYTTTTPLSYENGGMYAAKVIYNHGPVSASLSLLDVKVQGGSSLDNGNTQAYRAGVSYKDPCGLKVGLVFDHTAVSNSIYTATSGLGGSTASRDAFMIPVSYYFGDHAVYATYTHAGNTSSISNTSASQYNLVYDYALNKRAYVGIFCSEIHNSTNSDYAPFLAGTNLGPTSNLTGENWHQIGLNFMYWF